MMDPVAKRMELGSMGTRVFRHTESTNQILCLTEWGMFSKAREFMGSGDPHEIRTRSMVAGSPD